MTACFSVLRSLLPCTAGFADTKRRARRNQSAENIDECNINKSEEDTELPEDISRQGVKRNIGTLTFDPALHLDEASNIADLRWVGNEFIYFTDIPWLPDAHEHSLPHSPLSHSTNSIQSDSNTLSLRSVTLGLLEEFLGQKVVDELLLSCDPSGRSILAGEKLLRLVVPYARRVYNSTRSGQDIASRQLVDRLTCKLGEIASAIDQTLLTRPNNFGQPGPGRDKFCAVGTMLLAFSRCVRAISGDVSAVELLDSTRMLQEIITAYRDKLATSWSSDIGYEIERLLGAGIPFVAYATSSQPTINRSKFVDPSDYRPVHVDPSCTCHFIGPPLADIVDALAQNKIPVVIFDGDRPSVRDSADSPYAIISHVWADGLGSTTEEGLPRCQVSRIADLARKLVPDGAFWLDALCVPKETASRRRAIRLMAKTYECAARVLVIDGGIRTQCSVSSPKEEFLLRIATSGWMQRIWTLQEGMLARELYFEVSDGLIDCTHFNGAPYAIAKEVIPLLQHRPYDDKKLEYLVISPNPPRCTFNEIIPLLQHRTTSKPEDETIAIAGLLGIDASELAALSSAEARMRLLLLRCETLPRCIAVYGWHSRKLDMPGFTWAPMSVSEVFWWGDPLDPLWATCTKDGLRGRYTVVHFPPVDMGRVRGIIATVINSDPEERAPDVDWEHLKSVASHRANTDSITHGVRIDISPLFVQTRTEKSRSLVVNAVIITRPGLPPTEREEPVAAVFVPSLERSPSPEGRVRPHKLTDDGDGNGLLRCDFVAAGRLQVDPPSVHATSGHHWMPVEAKLISLIPVLLT